MENDPQQTMDPSFCDTIISLNISSGNLLDQALSNTLKGVERHEIPMNDKIYYSIQNDIVNYRQLSPNQIYSIAISSPTNIIKILQVYNKIIHHMCYVIDKRED